jgi:mannose-1-phosphate guanylyltransferase
MARWHYNKRSLATLALTEVVNPSAYGVLDIARGGRVRRFVEKPPPGREPSHLINAGVYILEPEVLDWIPDGCFSMFEKDVFPKLVEAGKPVYGYASRAYWIDIGTPDKYLAVNRDLVSGKVRPRWFKLAVTPVPGLLKCGVKVSGRVVIGKGTRLGRGVTLKGPAVIGSGCKIGENASLEGVVVWDKVKIGEGAALKECIIARNVCLGARCRIPEGCVIGDDTKIDEDRVLPEAQQIDPPGAAKRP